MTNPQPSRCTTLVTLFTALVLLTAASLPGQRIQGTTAHAWPNGRTGDHPPSACVDGSLSTYTWTTRPFNRSSSNLGLDFGQHTVVNRIRIWKDTFGDWSVSGVAKDLRILYTTDLGPMSSRNWRLVTGLTNGILGAELWTAAAVNPDGTVDLDLHDSLADGWASLTFDPVIATGVAIGFTHRSSHPYVHYRVYEFEAYRSAIDRLFLRPETGGNSGPLVIDVHGDGFEPGAVARLERDGGVALPGTNLEVIDSGLIRATFDLDRAPLGGWTMRVTNPDGTSQALADGFTVEDKRPPDVWVDLVGPSVLRAGRTHTAWVVAGNSGNATSSFSYALLRIPNGMSYEIDLPRGLLPETQPAPQEDYQYVGISIPSLRASDTVSIPITLRSAATGTYDIGLGVDPSHSYRPGASLRDSLVSTGDPNPVMLPTDQPPDPGYIVIWKDWTQGTASVAISIGDGMVAHFIPAIGGHPGGLAVHAYDFPNQPTVIMKPPGWTPQTAADFKADFESKWDPQMPGWYDGEQTSYRRRIGDYPDTNCAGWVFHAWPELQDLRAYPLVNGFAVIRAPGDLYDRLYWYWYDQGFSSFPYLWPHSELLLDLHRGWFQFLGGFRSLRVLGSFDPNDKYGPQGFGAERHIGGTGQLSYSIVCENLPTATLAAQDILITDQLDSSTMDLTTFELGPITVADQTLVPPAGLSQFAGEIDLRPRLDLIARVVAGLDPVSGIASWRFYSIDPATNQPTTSVLDGILPPNISPPMGDAGVLFTIRPKENLPTGTQIDNSAEIVFDANNPIVTPTWVNTIDGTSPISAVNALPPLHDTPRFTVDWSGSDPDSGVASFSIYVSRDGGPYLPWLIDSPATSSLFIAENNARYDFYAIAKDNAGNVERKTANAEASTSVQFEAIRPYGVGIAGSGGFTPQLLADGGPPQVANGSFRLSLIQVPGDTPCFIAGSFAPDNTSVMGLTFYGDFMTPGGFNVWELRTSGPSGSPGIGTSTLSIPIPNDPALYGFTTYWQGFVVDDGSPLGIGMTHSNALAVTVVR